MRNHKISTILLAGVCASLALPAAASAGMGDVNRHLKRADSALEKAERLVERSSDASAAVRMARANVQANKARRDARDIRSANRRARAERKVAVQYDQNSGTYVDLVDEVRGSVQDDVAGQIEKAINGRDRAVSKLTELLDRVPNRAVEAITKAISRISQSGSDEVTGLVEALGGGEIRPGAVDEVSEALSSARSSVESALVRLQGLVETLPAEAQGHVTSAIDRITNRVGPVFDMLDSLFGGGTPEIPVPPFARG